MVETPAGGARHRAAIHRLALAVALAGCIAGDIAAETVFDPSATRRCVAEATARSPALAGNAVLDCVGPSARACMMSPAGQSPAGMIHCLREELRHWEDRLQMAFAARLRAGIAEDAASGKTSTPAPSLVSTLYDMQAAWITYRDAACSHERARWLGGPASEPAILACQMHKTAQQALRLEGWWSFEAWWSQ